MIKARIQTYLSGTQYTFKNMNDPELIYYEAYSSEKLARNRELKLKGFGSSYAGLLKRLGLK